MPQSEVPIQIGDRRIVFVDGIGDFEAVVMFYDNMNCMVKDDDGEEWEIPFDSPGHTAVGILVNGEEAKKLASRRDCDSSAT